MALYYKKTKKANPQNRANNKKKSKTGKSCFDHHYHDKKVLLINFQFFE